MIARAGQVLVFTTALVVASLALASAASSAAAQGGRIFVTEKDRHRVLVFTPSGERLAEIPTEVGPYGMAAQGGKLYVMGRGPERAPGSGMSIIDLETLQLERTQQICEGCAPSYLAFGPKGVLLFGAQKQKAVFKLVPPYTGPAVMADTPYGFPVRLVFLPDSPIAVVGFRGAEQVAVVDTRTMSVTPVPIALSPEFVALRPGTKDVWVAVHPFSRLAVVRLAADGKTPEMEPLPGLRLQRGLAFSADGKLALVSASLARASSILDSATLKELGKVVFPGGEPGIIVPGPDGHSAVVLVGKDDGGLLAVVDFTDPTQPRQTATIPLEGQAVDVLWLP